MTQNGAVQKDCSNLLDGVRCELLSMFVASLSVSLTIPCICRWVCGAVGHRHGIPLSLFHLVAQQKYASLEREGESHPVFFQCSIYGKR